MRDGVERLDSREAKRLLLGAVSRVGHGGRDGVRRILTLVDNLAEAAGSVVVSGVRVPRPATPRLIRRARDRFPPGPGRSSR